jgi:hypothetical protein
MSFLKKWFGTSGKEKQARAAAQSEADKAKRLSEAALVNPADSDSARSAADRRLRKIGAMRGLAGTRMGRPGGGVVAQKQLMGG